MVGVTLGKTKYLHYTDNDTRTKRGVRKDNRNPDVAHAEVQKGGHITGYTTTDGRKAEPIDEKNASLATCKVGTNTLISRHYLEALIPGVRCPRIAEDERGKIPVLRLE